jgi:hypothetical protein
MADNKLMDVEGVKADVSLGGWFGHLPKEARWAIGSLLVFFLYFAGFIVLGKLPGMLDNTKKCWELQFKDERAFRVNACTGAVVELDIKTMEPKK